MHACPKIALRYLDSGTREVKTKHGAIFNNLWWHVAKAACRRTCDVNGKEKYSAKAGADYRRCVKLTELHHLVK